MKNPSIDTGLFSGLVVESNGASGGHDSKISATQRAGWPEIEKRIRMSAADPKDIEDWAVIVDDSTTSLLVIANVLKSLCIGIHPFIDATEALKFLRNSEENEYKKIFGVFSDLEMPGMDGIKFLQQIRGDEKLKDLPFIVASGHRDRKMIRQVAALKIQGYIMKPFNSEAVVEKVMSLKLAQKIAGDAKKSA